LSVSTPPPGRPASERPKRSPYQGLVPYTEDDAAYFFGRETARDIVLDNLLAYRMSILYGPSGVGKSSLLRAGVVHRVRDEASRRTQQGEAAEYAAVVFSSWAEDPVAGLKQAIRDTFERMAAPLAADLLDASLADVVGAAARQVDGSLLIILDQFEEYFLYHAGDGPFVEQLTRMIARRDAAASVLISIREDALATLDALAGRMPGVLDNLVRIEHLDRDAARAAIEKPLELWNDEEAQDDEQVRIEPALVEAVLDGVQVSGTDGSEFGDGGAADRGNGPSIQTPYLQLVLTRLWEEERSTGSRVLRLRTLERLQGARHIVASHVDAAIARLSPAEQAVAAGVLHQLVTPSGTKIAQRTVDLAAYAGVDERTVTAVLERLTREGRILQAIGGSRYEIYHDALARPILDWRRRWQARQDRARERRRIRIVASIAVGLLLTVLVVAVLALVAIDGRRVARHNEADAASVALASASRDELGSQPDVSLLLALAALAREDRPEARSAMIAAREAAGPAAAVGIMRGHGDVVNGIAFVLRGRAIVSAGGDGRVLFWDAATHRPLGRPLTSAGATFTALAVSPDGRTLAAGGEDGRIWLWDVASRRPLGILAGGRHEVFDVAFSADGHTLASAGDEHRIRLWDVTARRPLGAALRVPDRRTFSVAFSPDGRTLAAVGGLFKVRLWDVASRRLRRRQLGGAGRSLTSVAFSPDGRTLAVGGRRTWLWNVRSGRKRRVVAFVKPVDDVAFSPDGRRLAGGGEDGKTRLWDVASQRPLGPPITGPTARLNGVAFSPDGRTLAAAGDDKKVWLFDTARPSVLERHTNAVDDVAFDRTARTLATAGYDRRIWLWDTRTGQALGAPLVGADAFDSVAFSPDGRTLASGGDDARVMLWDLRSHRVVGQPLAGHSDAVNSVAFSPDGRLLASGSNDDTIILWDVRSHRPIGDRLRGHGDGVNGVAFSPDGRTLATAGTDGDVRLWDVRTHRPLGRALKRHLGMVNDVAFRPDGRTLASAGSDGRIWLWDVGTRRARGRLGARGAAVLGIAFSPDARTLIAGSQDGRIRLWDVADRRPLGRTLMQSGSGVNAVAVGSDGRTFASGSSDSTAKLWSHVIWRDRRALSTEVCGLVGSGLSPAEWAQYASGVSYTRVCDM
jgi:WD40 repeat protein